MSKKENGVKEADVPSKEQIEENKQENEKKWIKNAKDYFVMKFFSYFNKENNLILKRSESFRYLIKEIIEVNTEIKLAKNDVEVRRLNKAMTYLFEELSFIIGYNPIFKCEKLTKDFSQVKKLIDNCLKSKNNKNEVESFQLVVNKAINSLVSLNKKMNQIDIINSHFQIILKQVEAFQFNDVDIIVDSLVNESLFMHSHKHIKEWIEHYSKSNEPSGSDSYIENLQRDFTKENFVNKESSYIVRLHFPKSILEKINLDNEQLLLKVEDIKMFSDNILKFIKIENHLFPKKEGVYYIQQEVVAADKYKASDILTEKLNRFLEIYQLIGNIKGLEINTKGLIREQGMLKWEFTDIIVKDDESIQNKITNREEEDIKEFIQLRNKRIQNPKQGNELFLLERAYRLISNSKDLTLENQLLNAWLAIEHMVTPYFSDAIIEKIRQVIPKVVSLYYVKQRMNELWEEINEYSKTTSELDNFISECKSAGSWKYEKIKFANNLKNEDKVRELMEITKTDIILVRRFMEINGLLKKHKSTQKRVKEINGLVANDLNRIYRIRNKIVHSGVNVPDNLNLITLRLMKYNTRLLGTIIHYMKESDEVTIEGVLNSIVETYDWFVDEDTKGLSIGETITPRYLYI